MEFLIRVDEAAGAPLRGQVFEQLRQAVLEGRLRPGERLPSTRAFARRLGISRTTVCLAYDQLLAEGYVEGRHGAGTFVSAHLPDERLQAGLDAAPSAPPAAGAAPPLSAWVQRVPIEPGRPSPGLAYDFRLSRGAWETFPWSAWRRLLGRRLRRPSPETTAYGDPAGYGPLRAAIAVHLRRSRAVRCQPEQVVIVSGSQQTLDLLARILVNPGDRITMEDPGYLGARRVFQAYGAEVGAVPVDGAGLVVERLPEPRRGQPCKLVYVTPSHQFPTGATLSLARRLALLEWAARAGALVLEDDYDSDFRYGGRPLESLQGLDPSQAAIYMSSFSEALFPSLRIGYVVLPPALLDPFLAAKELSDRQTPTVEQQVLADFLTSGLFERHLRRMRKLYQGRRDALVAAIARELGPAARVSGAAAGLHLVVWLPEQVEEAAVVAEAAALEVGVQPMRPHFQVRPPSPALLLSYAALDTGQIAEGMARLGEAVRRSESCK
ncbi:MAG: PLP-dependent aminotransferase family protein [Chloroflexi bacterium]|nr:PLP-dependent aminotransferase family protein [Chloroflexota bacterium]